MPESLPSVSVVVPTYRRPAALRRCVEALARLEYPRDRLEVVVVDDDGGVPAGLFDGLEGLVHIKLLSQANRGPARARNVGARAARGTVVAFTDDDCAPRPRWLVELVQEVICEPSALVGGLVANALPGNLYSQASQDLVSYLYAYFPRSRDLRPFFTSNSIACRRDLFLQLGGFEESFRYSAGEDRDFSERWLSMIGPLRYSDRAVVDHFHVLDPGRFLRQHHYYGRGAVHLARRRRLRGEPTPQPEPLSFYFQMFQYSVRTHEGARGWLIGGLIILAQVAGLTGMVTELVVPSTRRP